MGVPSSNFSNGWRFLLHHTFPIYSLLYFRHAIDVLRGKYHEEDKEGEISHYEALSTAIAATVGMGNISGVAVAITAGGPELFSGCGSLLFLE